jgi:eukaryotic-like serine/threonine-protein kinase
VLWGGVGVLGELQPGDPAQVGPYQLAGVLGAGGMGRVYLGWSPGGRPVAVKVIRSELAADPEFRTRFRREVAAARAISGLYTAQVVDADTDSPVPWLATVYLDGPSLNEVVTSYGPLPAASVLTLAAGLAEALAAVHAMGLVHRDLKPSNVLLASDRPRVIDFGIARAAENTALTSTGQFIGTPGYLSPEQALGRPVGPPTDIFGLGAVLAFAASGNGPFGAGSTPAIVYRAVHEPPTLEGVPEKLRALIGMCLAKEPGDRPTASDLVAELADIQLGAQRRPEPITTALAGFAVPTPTQSVLGAAPSGKVPAVAAPARGSGGPRRFPRMRRSLLIPAASMVAVAAAVVTVLAATLGGPGGSPALAGGSPAASSSALAVAAHSAAPAAGTPSPPSGTSAAPTRSPSHQAAAKGAPTTRAPSSAVTVTAAAQSPASPTPTPTPPGPKNASGTYTFTRQVVTCTFSSCTSAPFVLTLTCPAPASCAASWSPWGSHPATYDGTTIEVSFTATGSVNCKGTALPTALTLNVTVLSWTAGQGGAVRTPTRMQGTITASAPASSLGCPAAGDVETITYG